MFPRVFWSPEAIDKPRVNVHLCSIYASPAKVGVKNKGNARERKEKRFGGTSENERDVYVGGSRSDGMATSECRARAFKKPNTPAVSSVERMDTTL